MRTPLYDEHVALGAKIVSFAGWEMPLSYTGIIPEHRHTRESASVFDTCHMGVFDLAGPSALADTEMLITQSAGKLKIGACSYGYLLAEDGGVLDDLICFRRGHDSFRLVVNAGTRQKDAEWIRSRVSDGTSFRDVSENTAKLDVQGPASKQEAERALGISLPDLAFFHFTETTVLDCPFMISRTGYTGEWGYEFLFPSESAVRLWKVLVDKSRIRPAGLGARDVLRLEMGYPLYGHELSERATPVAASRGRFMDAAKEFTGKAAVARELEKGTERVLVGLRMDGRQAARRHDEVLLRGESVGAVTSGLYSPSLACAVALAYVAGTAGAPGTQLDVRVRDKLLPATVVDLPFYKNGTARRSRG